MGEIARAFLGKDYKISTYFCVYVDGSRMAKYFKKVHLTD